MPLLEAFRAYLATLTIPAGPGLIAVSGGADSLALLDLLASTRDAHGLDLAVGHVDHGIHPGSAAVAGRVRLAAIRYGLAFRMERLSLGAGCGETEARRRRYDALARMAPSGLILTGHHRDDQVETVLLRVLSGSGPAGLAGMAARSGRLLRPLLPFSRADLSAHVTGLGVPVWNDPANLDPTHERSWLRTEIVPLLRSRHPELDARVTRLADQAALHRTGWEQVLDALPGLDLREERSAVSVAAGSLTGYHSALARCVILALARRTGLTLGVPGADRVLELARRGRSGSRADLGGGAWAEMAFGRIVLPLTANAVPGPAATIAGNVGEVEWGKWNVRWRTEPAPELVPREGPVSWFVPGTLQLRAWRTGDRIRPLLGTGSKLVVRCLQEAKIPASRRSAWPVVEDASGRPVWVPGVCRGAEHVPPPGTEALRIDVGHT